MNLIRISEIFIVAERKNVLSVQISKMKKKKIGNTNPVIHIHTHG
jgi:hypothetical protein